MTVPPLPLIVPPVPTEAPPVPLTDPPVAPPAAVPPFPPMLPPLLAPLSPLHADNSAIATKRPSDELRRNLVHMAISFF
jgi:hypothetical protein